MVYLFGMFHVHPLSFYPKTSSSTLWEKEATFTCLSWSSLAHGMVQLCIQLITIFNFNFHMSTTTIIPYSQPLGVGYAVMDQQQISQVSHMYCFLLSYSIQSHTLSHPKLTCPLLLFLLMLFLVFFYIFSFPQLESIHSLDGALITLLSSEYDQSLTTN